MFRSIGGLARPRANTTTGMADTSCPKCLDRPLALRRLLAKQGVVDLEFRQLDFQNASDAIPRHPCSYDVTNAMSANRRDGEVYLARTPDRSASVLRHRIGAGDYAHKGFGRALLQTARGVRRG